MTMHKTTQRIVAVVALVVMTACASDHRRTMQMERHEAAVDMDLCERIERLPRWPRDRHFTLFEWSQYATIALIIREMPEVQTRKTLSNWGEVVPFRGPGSWGRAVPWTEGDRLMILLRVVFQVPIEGPEEVHPPPGVAPFGGIPAAPVSPSAVGIGAPVWWRDDRPVLTAWQAAGGGTTGPTGAFYYPIEEYHYFRRHYPLRPREDLLAVIEKVAKVE